MNYDFEYKEKLMKLIKRKEMNKEKLEMQIKRTIARKKDNE